MTHPRILVVDDDAKISALLRLILEHLGGYLVREENRSSSALATAREFRPHLVLLDVDMPGKDGGKVAAEIARDPQLRATPCIFVTALTSRHEAGVRSGALVVSKPVDPTLLLENVRRRLLPPLAA